MAEIKIIHGDNIELLKTLPDNSIDSIVTDCPYGLGKEPNAVELIQAWATVGYLEIKGKGFMGKSWDAFVPQPLFWKEAIRVLKPGGHVAAFFGTRTYDWGVLAMRMAGFEIRDMVCWIYGSGFPKSVNCGDGVGTALKPAVEPICIARKPFKGTIKENISIYGTAGLNIDGCRIEFASEQDKINSVFGRGTDIMGGNFVGAKHSSGKTNIQPNDLGRFPANMILDTFTANILDEQTGELRSGKPSGIRSAKNNIYGDYGTGQEVTGFGDTGGASRFFYCAKSSTSERNAGCEKIITWENEDLKLEIAELLELLKDMSEDTVQYLKDLEWNTILSGNILTEKSQLDIKFIIKIILSMIIELKICNSSRQLSIKDCILAALRMILENGLSLVENAENLNQLIPNTTNEKTAYLLGVLNAVLQMLLKIKEKGKSGNIHSTVKPIAVMRWIMRLITPKGGKCLDPFAGSGTTGCAAAFENVDIVLMELESEYIPIIEARTKYWQKKANRENYEKELLSAVQTLF